MLLMHLYSYAHDISEGCRRRGSSLSFGTRLMLFLKCVWARVCESRSSETAAALPRIKLWTFHYLAAFEHGDLETEPIRRERLRELHSTASSRNDTSHIKRSPQAGVCISLSVKAFIYISLVKAEVADKSFSSFSLSDMRWVYRRWMQMTG